MAKVEIGGHQDALHIRLGALEYVLTEHYELKASFFQQPAGFTLRLGPKLTEGESLNGRRERLVKDVLAVVRPNTEFELFVARSDGARVIIQSGRTDARGSPGAKPLQAEVKGRDYMCRLFDAYVEEETSFTEKTYYDLTRKILDLVGLPEEKRPDGTTRFALLVSPDNTKRINASRKQATKKNTELIREHETGALSGGGKLVLKTLVAKLGTRYWDFLQQNLKLAGLWLYVTGEGNFILTRPDIDQEPAFHFIRAATAHAGVITEDTNVLDHRFDDDTTHRHSKVIVYGHNGGGRAGRNKLRGECVDEEMVAYGFNKPLTVNDEDVKSVAECEYLARKMVVEERRAGWRLSYVVSGHTTPSLVNPAGRAIWGPNMMARVDDDQLDIHADLWIDSITFNRNPQATSTIELVWPSDLVVDPPPTPAVPKPAKKDFKADPAKQPRPGPGKVYGFLDWAPREAAQVGGDDQSGITGGTSGVEAFGARSRSRDSGSGGTSSF